MSTPENPGPATAKQGLRGLLPAEPLARALGLFVAGMALLMAIDLASEPHGDIGENRAVDAALAASTGVLSGILADGVDPLAPDGGTESPKDEERRERAQSAAFFVEQANVAWRRGLERPVEQVQRERSASGMLATLGALWALGWLLLPAGALATRLVCPGRDGRAPYWTVTFSAYALGGSAGLVALALGIYGLGVPSPFVLAPLIVAIVALNARLLQRHTLLDRGGTLLRLAPLLVLITVMLVLGRELLIRMALLV